MGSVGPKLVRGRILGLLAKHAPDSLTVELLYMTLDAFDFDTPKARIREHLVLLQNQGFIELDEGYDSVAEADYCRASIRQKGLALVRGDIDPESWIDPRGYEGDGT